LSKIDQLIAYVLQIDDRERNDAEPHAATPST
jgi:hypothetical protein